MGFSRFRDENIGRAQRATVGAERLGGQAESEFFQRATNFDPQRGAEESAQGIVSSLTPSLRRNLEFARGQAVGSGRLNTGFFDIDRGRIFEDFNQRVASAIASNALQAQQQQLQNIGQIGQFGQNVQNRFVNLLGGSLDRAQQEENAKRQGGGLFGKLLGGAAGIAGGLATGNPFAAIGGGAQIVGGIKEKFAKSGGGR